MLLLSQPLPSVPDDTARIARAAFRRGNPYVLLRDKLGQPAYAPWRLALVTLMRFREGLRDRQAADAVRGRIDRKYLLALDLADASFDFSVLCEFRGRLFQHEATEVAHFMRTLGITTPEQLRQVDHRAVIAWECIMREEQGAAASTVRRCLAALSSLFKYLERYGAATRNPVVDVTRPSINREEGSALAFSKAQAGVSKTWGSLLPLLSIARLISPMWTSRWPPGLTLPWSSSWC